MGNLVFQATLGGQVNLVGPNTASTFNLNVPAVSATLATTDANTFTAAQTFTAGSASAPALTTTGDTNTGVFFPAADTVGISTGGSERARVDSSGNLGLGVTPSAWGTSWKTLQLTNGVALSNISGLNALYLSENAVFANDQSSKYIASDFATLYQQYNGQHRWFNAPSGTAGNAISFTQAMTLDASGNLLVGGSSSVLGKLEVSVNDSSSSADGINIRGTQNNAYNGYLSWSDTWSGDSYRGKLAAILGYREDVGKGQLRFFTYGSSALTERARIDSSGNLLVGATSQITIAGSNGAHCFSTTTTANWASVFQQTSATPLGVAIRYASDSNNTSNDFLYCVGNATLRASIRSNGGLANFSANNVNLSDERTKTDIQDAGSYLAKICAIPIRTFKYKDQTDDELNLGVIAQEVESVAPELVDVSGFGETPEDGVPLKAIYQTDLQYALMKCIQEQQAIITQLQADVAALKGQA